MSRLISNRKTNLNAVDNKVKTGLATLGAAIGNTCFVAAFLSKRVNKIEKLLDNLAYLNKSQCAVGIPRSCHGAQIWYIPRDVTLRQQTPLLFCRNLTIVREQT